MQAHAALYQWHKDYKLDSYPFKKCSSATVLQKLRQFANDYGIQKHAAFGAEVKDISYEQGRCAYKNMCWWWSKHIFKHFRCV